MRQSRHELIFWAAWLALAGVVIGGRVACYGPWRYVLVFPGPGRMALNLQR
jgi:hypothetical protein